MKNFMPILTLTLIAFFTSCQDEEPSSTNLFSKNLQDITQTFTIDLDDQENSFKFYSDAGCEFRFSKKGFTKNGEVVDGTIKIEIIEIFDKGTMAITGKHTMSGNQILISGGEFLIEATQEEEDLDYQYSYNIRVPTELTGSFNPDMQLFRGVGGQNSQPGWELAPNMSDTFGVFNIDSSAYLLALDDFMWFNCDRFLNDPRELIDLNTTVPGEYEKSNHTVYLSIKNEPSSLGVATYGTFPLGLDAHLIFIAQEEDKFVYQILSDKLSEKEYKFESDKLQTASPKELKDIINNLD